VGFENNLYRPDGTRAADNAEQVARACALVREAGRTVASPAEARAVYGLTR
jgi:uncharacterized protein (DUF849 family)